MESYSVLIVDDDVDWNQNLSLILKMNSEALTGDRNLPISIQTAEGQDEADERLAIAPSRGYDMIVIDRQYPLIAKAQATQSLGDDWLPIVRNEQPNAVIAVATHFASEEDNLKWVEALRDYDVDDFITKKLPIPEIFNRLVAASEHRKRLIRSRIPHHSNVLKVSTEDIHLAFSKARTRLRALVAEDEVEEVFSDLQEAVEHISGRFQGPISPDEKELRSVDLQRVINQELPSFEGQLPKGRVRLMLDGKRRVTTYEADVRDAFREILQNSVDALEESGTYSEHPITITVRPSISSALIDIEVSDDGRGFSDQALQTLYQPGTSWWTLNPSRHKGMGLYVAKRMMQAVGGDIRYEGTGGGGATMVLSVRDWSAK